MPTAYRAENIGSLLRPEEVLVARSEYCSGKIDVTQLRTVEDQAIVAALDLQAAVGIDIFTDGEYRRDIFTADITAAVDGFIPTNRDATANWRGPHRDGALRVRQGDKQLVVGDKLRKKGRLVPGEAPFLKRYAPGPFKVCIPSVSYWTSKYQPGTSDTY